MAGSQTLAFDIVGNASSAARAFKDTADTAALAARGATMASDAMKLQAKSAEVSAGATLALARADKILADAELGLARDMTVANAVLGRQNTALLGSATAGAVGSMLSAAASGKAPSSGGGGGLAPGIAMAAAAMGIARQQSRLFTDSISQGAPVWDSARKGIFGLNGELQLFGGALTSVGIPHVLSAATAVHLLTEGVVETSGTLIPAAIAFSAFGIAAVPTVMSIYTQMSNLHTVTTALGTDMPGLSGGFSRMADAVKPQVYTLFGEALVFANSGTGQMQQLATGAGKVLDDLGARFVFATTQGKGFSAFTEKATSDLSAWGTGIGNVGGIIGNLLKVLPGYAEELASVFDGVTHSIEVVTGSPLGQWVLGIGLAAHGALFYVGLLGTGLAVLASRGLSLVATSALSAATAVEGLGVAGEAAAGGMLAFGGAAETAAALPWGWISIAVAGLAILAYRMSQAKDETQQFYGSLQQLIQNSSLSSLQGTITAAQAASLVVVAQRTREAATAEGAYTQSLKQGISAAQVHAGYVTQQQSALQGAVQAQHEAVAGNDQLNATYALVNSRIAALSKEYGGNAAALALLNEAGITSGQITDTNNQHWQQSLIEIKAQAAALNEMSIGAGRTAAGMNALGNSFVTGTLPALQKMTQAEDALTALVTSGQQGFIAWAQGVQQADKDASAYHATLGGLNAQSLTLASDYYGTLIPASQKLIDALQQQGASTSDLRTAVAGEVRQMLPFTAGNLAAKSVLVDLVNNALGPGTVSLQNLASWTGKNSGTMDGFKAIVDKATVSAGNLASTLSGLLNSAFAADILKASGASGAVDAYAAAITRSGADSEATRSARANLVSDLEKTGLSSQQAKSYVDNLQRSIAGLQGKTVQVGVHASGSGSITATENIPGGTAAKQNGHLVFFAAGGRVTGGVPGKDSVLGLLKPGEVVVPEHMVAGGAVDHLRGKLPGFASGGLVGGGLVDFTADREGGFGSSSATGFAQAMAAAFQKAMAAAAAAAAAKAAAGTPVAYSKVAGVTQWEPDVSRVLGMLGLPQADLPTVMAQILTESGGNPNAINLTDSNAAAGHPSKGLLQVIAGTFAAYRNPSLSSNIYDPLANIYAGLNYAVHRYGNPGWLSVLGHGHGYAGGTSSAAPGWAVVGESGPEIVRFRGGEQVIPNRGTSGGGVHVHLHNDGVIGSQSELENWAAATFNNLARNGRLRWALQQSPSARG